MGGLNCLDTASGQSTWYSCNTATLSQNSQTTTSTTQSPSSTTSTTPTSPSPPPTTSPSAGQTRPDGSISPPTSSKRLKDTPTTSPISGSSTASSPLGASQTALPTQQHSGIPSGATAGIAVGCVAAGLIIGLLAALLLFRRRKYNGSPDIRQTAVVVESKAPPSTENFEAISSGVGVQLGRFLLDGAPDQEIVSELRSLGELIRQHVEEHYSLQPVDANVQTLSHSLQNLGLGLHGLGMDTQEIATLCANSYSRHLGLRHVISTTIFASIDVHSRSRFSMLPAPVAGLLQSIPAAENGGNNSLAFSQALSTWRRLSAFLLHQNRSQRTPLQMDETAIIPQAQLLTSSLANFLSAFAKPGGGSQQPSHLQEVVIECAKLGYVLFSHPVEWQFIFERASRGTASEHSVVVCPGLEKCSDRDGNPYRPPRRVVAPVEVSL